MKRCFNYALFFLVSLFIGINGVLGAEKIRQCTYQFQGSSFGTSGVTKIDIYFSSGGVSAYSHMGNNNGQQINFTESVRNYFSSDEYLNESKSCPNNAYISREWDKISFSEEELGSDIKRTTGIKQTDVVGNAVDNSGNASNQGPQHFNPVGGGPSIFTGKCPTDLGFVKLLKTFYGLLKIATPIMLIIFGMLDFAKAMASSDESKMKKAQSAFVRRIIAAVVVFLVMSIMSLVANLIPSESGVFSCVKQILE